MVKWGPPNLRPSCPRLHGLQPPGQRRVPLCRDAGRECGGAGGELHGNV